MREKKPQFSIERSADATRVFLVVSGRIDAEASALLGPECASIFEARYGLTLDLRNATFADRAGMKLLNALWARGATLINVPTKIARKMETDKYRG